MSKRADTFKTTWGQKGRYVKHGWTGPIETQYLCPHCGEWVSGYEAWFLGGNECHKACFDAHMAANPGLNNPGATALT